MSLFANNKNKEASHMELIHEFLPRLAAIESSGNPNAVGDKGRSLGLYQLSKEAWRDATDWARLNLPDYVLTLTFNGKPLGTDYKKECLDPDSARWVATFYLLYLAKRMESNKWKVNMKSLYVAYNCGYNKGESFSFDMSHYGISDKRKAIFYRAACIIDAQLTTHPHSK